MCVLGSCSTRIAWSMLVLFLVQVKQRPGQVARNALKFCKVHWRQALPAEQVAAGRPVFLNDGVDAASSYRVAKQKGDRVVATRLSIWYFERSPKG